MKTLAVSVILVSLTVPAYARNRRIDLAKPATAAPVELSVKVLPEGRTTATRLFSQVRKSAARSRRNCVGASAVVDNRSARLVVIPAVGSVRGGGGTFFRSDITFVNWNSDDQRVRFLYLPNGNAAGTITAEAILPGDRPPFTVADFVGTQLLTSGLGSLIIVPVDASGQFDENGAIDAYSRIYTPQPNTTRGTVSQPFAGADPDHLSGEYEAIVLGLRQDADYRTNFGIVNLFDTPLEFSVLVLPESAPPGTPLTEVFVTLPPLSMVQQALPAGSAGPISLIVGVETEVPDDDQAWTTYASSTDNVTGDGWVSTGAAILDDEGLDDREQ